MNSIQLLRAQAELELRKRKQFSELEEAWIHNDVSLLCAEAEEDWEQVALHDAWKREHASLLQSPAYQAYQRQRSPVDTGESDRWLSDVAVIVERAREKAGAQYEEWVREHEERVANYRREHPRLL